MTADFEVAVEEGATLIRVGTALFGPRPARPAAPAREAGAPSREAAREPVTCDPYDSVRSADPDFGNRTNGRSRWVRRDFCGEYRHSVAGAAQGGRPQVLGQLSTW